MTDSATTTHRHARTFAALHEQDMFVLANVWDAGSARLVARQGAPALATTSSGISWSLGLPDGEHLTRQDALDSIGRICNAVDVPVSADLEGGYGETAGDVGSTIAQAIDAGAVGANLEDSPGPDGEPLREIDDASARIAAARAAADDAGVEFTINARTDVYLRGVGEAADRQALVLERAAAFADAGASCLFVPGLLDGHLLAEIVGATSLPVNVLAQLGSGPSLATLRALGVRRVSLGGALARAAYGAATAIAAAVAAGDLPPGTGIPSHADLQAAFGDPVS